MQLPGLNHSIRAERAHRQVRLEVRELAELVEARRVRVMARTPRPERGAYDTEGHRSREHARVVAVHAEHVRRAGGVCR
jgi:hypothetical protein